ncbi:MAG: nicotinate (nicotinamide) nucleotide adenylyltransferase [Leptospirales bacterium]|nr:nicotinate (nicotinamide) nucleotide adenylyltransferase [Leptospirales bacterium]
MEIGIFGGTFNPIHSGHIKAAKIVAAELSLARVIFVPVKDPVHKKLDGNASPDDRLAMLELAVNGIPSFDVDPIEINRDEPSYTVHTLSAFKEKYPGSALHLILGSDSFNTIDSWFDYVKILSLALFVVPARPGDEGVRVDLLHTIPGLTRLNGDFDDISSSLVRQRVKEGLSIEGLVPEAVARYIKDKRLYL